MAALDIRTRDPRSRARTATLRLAHGEVRTPAFVPLATKAVVKTLEVREVRELGFDMVLGNTFRENLGDGDDPWPAAQLEAIERAAAAICRHHGWNERSVIGHLEWQPGKVDPRGFTMASMRERIRDRLK